MSIVENKGKCAQKMDNPRNGRTPKHPEVIMKPKTERLSPEEFESQQSGGYDEDNQGEVL